MPKDILILDADSIAYRASAANETKSITASHVDTNKETHWDNRTAFRAFLKENALVESSYIITDVQDPRHISYGKSLVKEMIKNYKTRTGVDNAEIYISGADNFRDVIPLPTRYKAGRDGTIRPVQLKEIRQFMIDDLGAIVVNGMEVDDMSSIRAYEGWKAKDGRVIQLTADKDALQCTGWLFNPDKHSSPVLIKGLGELHREGTKVKGTGRMWLYFQALYGDQVDSYHASELWKMQDPTGKRKFGEVAAYDILKGCKTDVEAWTALYNHYSLWYPEPLTYTAWNSTIYTKDAVDIMQMYFDAAFMLRWRGDNIDCRETLAKLGIV